MPTTDPLARLVVDQQEVDRGLLATVLQPHVALDLNREAFSFRRGSRSSLKNAQVVLVTLLARKALVLLGAEMEEPLTPKELESLTGMKGGSIRPALKTLADDGAIRRDEAGRYFVPDFALADVAGLVPSREEEA